MLTFATSIVFPPLSPERLDQRRDSWYPERSLGAFDGAEIVGHARSFPFHTVVPGGARVPTAGVTAVGVLASHRRQGLLTRLMQEQLQGCFDGQEPLASLRASESVIYGRFGYGLAGLAAEYRIDKWRAAFARPVDVPGRIRFVWRDEARKVVPSIYDRSLRRVGMVTRFDWMWDRFYGPTVNEDEYGFVAIHEDARGRADG